MDQIIDLSTPPKGYLSINSPYLASTEDGNTYWNTFALRSDLPDTDKLTSISNYKEIVDLLGAPTLLPIRGDVDDKWAYDIVSWSLYTPLNSNSIKVLDITVARKSLLNNIQNDEYHIESYSVSIGILTKSK